MHICSPLDKIELFGALVRVLGSVPPENCFYPPRENPRCRSMGLWGLKIRLGLAGFDGTLLNGPHRPESQIVEVGV